METLYDLLSALPRDDAEELRAAFRRAVKGVHPDLNPNDPDAGQKFRELVRANEILGDEEQRAAYDHLLALARKERKQQSTVKVMHKAAIGAIALVVTTSLGFGGYIADAYSPEFSVTLKRLAGVTLVQPGAFASAAPPAPSGTQPAATAAKGDAAPIPGEAAAAPGIQMASAELSSVIEKKQAATDALVPIPVTPIAITPTEATPDVPDNTATANVGPPLEIAPGDPKVFRERGIFAYRSGDLAGAVAEFDRAIELDPKFSAAYVDRSIVLYRQRKFERAFADIAQAKRLEKANRAAKAAAAAAAKKPRAAKATAFLGFPVFQRRTAKLEAATP